MKKQDSTTIVFLINPSRPLSSSHLTAFCRCFFFFFLTLARGRQEMEGRKSFVDELFPVNKPGEGARQDSLTSVFPPCPTVTGKGSIPSEWRKTGAEGGNSWARPAGKSQCTGKKNGKPANFYEFTESCLMSSSVHYGGRDDFITDASTTYNSGAHFSCKKNTEDDSGNSDVATRGDWWQGSFYY